MFIRLGFSHKLFRFISSPQTFIEHLWYAKYSANTGNTKMNMIEYEQTMRETTQKRDNPNSVVYEFPRAP